jgi:hypothetical protein
MNNVCVVFGRVGEVDTHLRLLYHVQSAVVTLLGSTHGAVLRLRRRHGVLVWEEQAEDWSGYGSDGQRSLVEVAER